MYSDEDLDDAVQQGIFTDAAVKRFKAAVTTQSQRVAVDEENFRLVSSFNDIFVAMACLLLLFCALWMLKPVGSHDSVGLAVFSMLAWVLAEVFVLKRKMALPAIALLLCFIGGLFAFVVSLFGESSETALMVAAAVCSAAAYAHWLRFRVPITLAAGTAAVLGFVVLLLLNVFSYSTPLLLILLFVAGVLTFCLAMYWDGKDKFRNSRHSDVAFWLHLLSAPLMIHPVFAGLGVLDGNEQLGHLAIIILLYLFLSAVSIAIDRRAFMFSALAYVLYALSSLFKDYGGVGYSFALTGVCMGTMLLFISAFWQQTRRFVVNLLPAPWQRFIPELQ